MDLWAGPPQNGCSSESTSGPDGSHKTRHLPFVARHAAPQHCESDQILADVTVGDSTTAASERWMRLNHIIDLARAIFMPPLMISSLERPMTKK